MNKIFTILTLLVFTFILFVPKVNAVGNVTLTLSPDSGTIADQEVDLNINTNGTAISTIFLNITYDSAVWDITAEGITFGTDVPLDTGLSTKTVSNGVITLELSTGLQEYTGSGTLLSIRMVAKSELTEPTDSTLTFGSDASVVNDDVNNNYLSAEVLGATYTYTADPTYVAKDDLPGTAIFDNNPVGTLSVIALSSLLIVIAINRVRKAKLEV